MDLACKGGKSWCGREWSYHTPEFPTTTTSRGKDGMGWNSLEVNLVLSLALPSSRENCALLFL